MIVSGHARASSLLLVLVFLSLPTFAAAQRAPVITWTAGEPVLAGRAELWARRVERALEREGAWVVTEDETWAYEPSGFARANLAEVQAIELLLFLSRTRASELDEQGALAALIEAERRGESVVALAGGAAWYAEVEVQIAIAAFQLGERSLARAALERAASIDPSRSIRLAEAPPELVALADRAVLSARTASVSRFEVRLQHVVPDARVFVDDAAAGSAPARIQVGAGLHALRVEAPGYRPWASLVRVLPGSREPVEVVLSPQPAVAVARELRAAVTSASLDRIPMLLAALSEHGVVLEQLVLVAVGEGPFDRALVIGCDPRRCRVAQRLEGDEPARRDALVQDHEAPIGTALAWLEEGPDLITEPPPSISIWEEGWPFWVIGGVVVAGIAAGVTAGVLVDEQSAGRSFVINLPMP
jgi:hypothetical protein